MKTGIFIVDDHYMVIAGIRSLLDHEKAIEWMGHAMTGESCLAFLQKQQPDILLMDINLPDISGIDLCKQVKQLYPAIAVVGLSTYNQQPYIRNMLENGASGYVLKNATKEELLDAISEVLKGGNYLSFEAALSLREPGNSAVPLITRREKEVLLLIAAGLTNAEIAAKLFISITTVNTHRRSLLDKFNAKNTAILIGKATRHGIV